MGNSVLAQGLLNSGRATLLLGCLEVCLEDSLDKAGETYWIWPPCVWPFCRSAPCDSL